MDFGRRPVEFEEVSQTPSLDKAVKRSKYGKVLYFINKNLMALSTMLMIVIALLITLLLRKTIKKPWTKRKLMNLKFIGEIFIRILLSLIVPLIGSSIAFACTGFDPKTSGRIMSEIISYYLLTTTLATIEGLTIVSLIRPGHRTDQPINSTSTIIKHTEISSNTTDKVIMIEDTILDMIRNIFTDSIFQSWISTYHTKLIPPKEDNNNSTDPENWLMEGEQIPGANVMSVVLFGLMVGLCTNMIRSRGGRIIVDLVEAINTMMMMITLTITQLAPVCTVFLIIPQILAIPNLADMFRLVAWFTATVLLSLSFHCFIILSLLYLIFVKKNPYHFLGKMFPAASTAFATSSSSASMSVTMQCLELGVGLPASIVRFIIPFGATVNMDGAALYESVAAIFVAQYRKRPLNLGQLITIAITSILVSIGAAGIPQAGMITTVVVLNSIGLSLEDAALVVVVDFLLDRFRTVVNILGDAFGAAIVGARLKHMFSKSKDNKDDNNDDDNDNGFESESENDSQSSLTTTTGSRQSRAGRKNNQKRKNSNQTPRKRQQQPQSQSSFSKAANVKKKSNTIDNNDNNKSNTNKTLDPAESEKSKLNSAITKSSNSKSLNP